MDSSRLFETLVREHYDSVQAFLFASVRESSTVEDLLQETFLVAWRNLDRYDCKRPFGPWVRGIASKLLLNFRRKLGRSRLYVCDHAILDTLGKSFGHFDTLRGASFDEQIEALQGCLECLSPAQRQAIDQHYEHGQPCKAIASGLGIQLEAAKKLLQRARAALERCLRSKMPAEQEEVA